MAGFKINNKTFQGVVNWYHNYIQIIVNDKFTIDDWMYFINWEKLHNETQYCIDIPGFNPNCTIYCRCYPVIDDDTGSLTLSYNHKKILKKRYY
jgi:hypothetical protein